MTNKIGELRDILKYRKFKLLSDGSIIYFQLSSVFKNALYIGEYIVKNDNDILRLVIKPSHFGQFNNVWVITNKGEKYLFNTLIDKLKINNADIILEQMEEEQIPNDIKEKLDQLYLKNEI